MGEISADKAVEILKESREKHNLKQYNRAIRGYDIILNSKSLPNYIKNEAMVCKTLAQEKSVVSNKYSFSQDFISVAKKGEDYYKKNQCIYLLQKEYKSTGKYFNNQHEGAYRESNYLKFDSQGIPMVNYNDKFYYNPVTACQYALFLYDKYIDKEEKEKDFLKVSDFLIKYMKEDGSFRYGFKYWHYEDLNPGWTSSMSQGQALSVFSRAYNLTKDFKYIEAGNKALKYMLTPVSQGGVMDNLGYIDSRLKDKIFFQEYVNSTPSYTLNGYIFTLIGLYDWSNIATKENKEYCNIAKDYWDKGIDTLKYILPYYDMGGFTSYDLYFITKKMKPTSADYYHSVHIEQLNTLYNITKDVYFKRIKDLWAFYVM